MSRNLYSLLGAVLLSTALKAQIPVMLKVNATPALNGQTVLVILGKTPVFQKIVDAEFTAKGTLAEPGLVNIKIGDIIGKGVRSLYIDSAAVTLQVDDSLNVKVIAGSQATRDHDDLERKSLGKDHAQLKDQLYKAYIVAHPDAQLSVFLLHQLTIAHTDYADQMPFFDKLSARAKTSKEGMALNERLNASNSKKIGAKARPFTAPGPDGKMRSLAELLKKHQYLLIDFWASWCVPCRAENPNIVAAYQRFKTKGFGILSISLDSDKASWLAAIAKDGMNWDHVSMLKRKDDPLATLYGVTALPQNFLVAADGTIIGTDLRGAALSEKLTELLK